MSRLEVLVVRDPDSYTDVRIWVDGVEVEFASVTVDPGAGHMREDWAEAEREIAEADYSPGFRAAALEAHVAYDDSEYITEW